MTTQLARSVTLGSATIEHSSKAISRHSHALVSSIPYRSCVVGQSTAVGAYIILFGPHLGLDL